MTEFPWMNSEDSTADILQPHQVWGLLSQFPPFRYFPIYCQNRQKTRQLLNIRFIFGRCRRSSAAVTLGQYGCDWNNSIYTFARSKILLTDKLANGALVIPTLYWTLKGTTKQTTCMTTWTNFLKIPMIWHMVRNFRHRRMDITARRAILFQKRTLEESKWPFF